MRWRKENLISHRSSTIVSDFAITYFVMVKQTCQSSSARQVRAVSSRGEQNSRVSQPLRKAFEGLARSTAALCSKAARHRADSSINTLLRRNSSGLANRRTAEDRFNFRKRASFRSFRTLWPADGPKPVLDRYLIRCGDRLGYKQNGY